MLRLNQTVAEAISNQVNRDAQQVILTPLEVRILADGKQEDTSLADFYTLCRLYGEVAADAPMITVIDGIAYCTHCGEQTVSDSCSCRTNF